MIDPVNSDDLRGGPIFPLVRERLELACVAGRHLSIEIALNDEHRLADVPHHLGRVERQETLEPGRVRLFAIRR